MKKSFALILSLIILAGCSDNTRKTPSGMRFKIIRQGDGKLARVGEVIVFDYLLKDSRDSVWVSTYDTYPSAYIINDSSMIPQEGGIVQMLRMLSKGDSVVVNMSVNEFYRQATNERPRVIDPSLRMIYAFRVLDIMTNREYTEYQRNVMRVFNQRQMAKDKSAIDAFLASRNIRADTTENGIRYVITKPGEGPLAQSGQTVRVNYIGYLLNGQYFDTNLSEYAHQAGLFDPMRTYEPMEVTIDQSNVIAGWHEALKKLNKGAKGTFYIPSLLAYGGTGMGETIKPYSVLVFDIELVDFKEEKKAKKK